MSKGLVLVVDDNQLNRTLLETNLIEEGYMVLTATNGREALGMLRQASFDVMLLDLLMPEMDGYQVLEIIQSDQNLRHIPVIVISALDEMDSVVRCIEMGATDYLTKPFDPLLLRARLNACLASKRLYDLEQEHMRAIQVERERADRLLLNILPEIVAAQLKLGAQKIVDRFDDVSVLFADIVNFTPWVVNHHPDELLEVMETVFSAFDQLVEKHQAEKIKTIGDAYMVACGVPEPCKDHLQHIADMALEMRQEFYHLPIIQRENLDIRIGINCGPVVAGVIGQKKFSYDLWGETVNTAARLQTHCQGGEIHTTEPVYLRLKDEYLFQEKGPVQIKGLGHLETYLLIGKK
jgi:class 3 adenylate cyclase